MTGSITRVSYALSSLIFIMGALIVAAFSLLKPALLNDIKAVVTDKAAPVIATVQKPVHSSIAFIRNVSGLATLQETNIKLAAENSQLKEWYLRAKSLQAENAELRKLVNLQVDSQTQYVTVQTLFDTSSPFAKSFLVKTTPDLKLQKSAPVVTAEGVVGRVIEVGESTARVLLLTDMNSRIPVMIDSNGDMIQAVVVGQNSNSLKIMHVPYGKNVKEGAHIMTSGLGGIYPKGLPVGVVAQSDVTLKNMTATPYAGNGIGTYVKILTQQ